MTPTLRALARLAALALALLAAPALAEPARVRVETGTRGDETFAFGG